MANRIGNCEECGLEQEINLVKPTYSQNKAAFVCKGCEHRTER